MVAQNDSFDVPQAVRDAAQRGLEMRRKYGRGGLDTQQASEHGVGSGVQRASDLISGRVTYRTIKRMVAFFSRHYKNRNSRMPNGEPGAGMVAWLIWGGDPGFAWAKRIVEQQEKVKKGGFLDLLYFQGATDSSSTDSSSTDSSSTDSSSEKTVQKAKTFSELISASKKPVISFKESDLEEVDAGYEYTGEVVPLAPPADAVAPVQDMLTVEQANKIAESDSDEVAADVVKSVVEIDLMDDYAQKPKEPDFHEKPTDPPPAPEPELQVVVTEQEHSALKKIIKGVIDVPALEAGARKLGKLIMRGDWAKLDVDLVCSYLLDTNKFNYAAVGGSAMLNCLAKAAPKVPQKYLEGLQGEERAKRKKFIQNRVSGKHEGDKYKDFPGDKDAKTKPSKYSKTSFAAQVREEMKGSSKADFLSAAAKVSGISRTILDKVYRRGSEAWATGGHRVGASQEAWARARVYSFVVGGRARTTADKDLWQEHLDNKKD